MELTDAQNEVWARLTNRPKTNLEALATLNQQAYQALEAFEAGDLLTTQSQLELTLVQMLATLKSFQLDPDRALMRALNRLDTQHQKPDEQQAFWAYPDRLEIRKEGVVVGGWPLYSEADRVIAHQMAQELGCLWLEKEETENQLGLFAAN